MQCPRALAVPDSGLFDGADQLLQSGAVIYTRQCAIAVNAKDLGLMAGTLANGGKNPVTKKQVVDPRQRQPAGKGKAACAPLIVFGKIGRFAHVVRTLAERTSWGNKESIVFNSARMFLSPSPDGQT